MVPSSPVVEAGSRIRARRFFWQIPQETGVPPSKVWGCSQTWQHPQMSPLLEPPQSQLLAFPGGMRGFNPLSCEAAVQPELFLQGARFLHPLPPAPQRASPGEGRGTVGRRLGGRIRAGGLQARLGKAKEDRGGNVEAGELHEPTRPPRSIPPWPFPLHQSFLRRRSCGCQEQNKGVGRPGLLLGRSPWG